MFMFKRSGRNSAIYCIINGKRENLEKIQKMIDSGKELNGNIAAVMTNEYKMETETAQVFEKYVIENGIPVDFDKVKRWYDSSMLPKKHLKEGKNHGYCIINGKVENLEKVQEMLDSGKNVAFEIAKIMMDEYKMEGVTAIFFGTYVNQNGIPINFDEVKRQNDLRVAQKTSSRLHCPRCHSTDVEERSFAPFVWSAPEKFWYCNKCRCEFGHHY